MDVRLYSANKTVQDTKVDFKLQLVFLCALHTAHSQYTSMVTTLHTVVASCLSTQLEDTNMCSHT